mmetsp:Transcript_26095/g.77774  ORF Transcript_26095/g.77774 Transcript_26095/m.77774 type:complete len:412 (+) Transcript_26095:1689-2924(+)
MQWHSSRQPDAVVARHAVALVQTRRAARRGLSALAGPADVRLGAAVVARAAARAVRAFPALLAGGQGVGGVAARAGWAGGPHAQDLVPGGDEERPVGARGDARDPAASVAQLRVGGPHDAAGQPRLLDAPSSHGPGGAHRIRSDQAVRGTDQGQGRQRRRHVEEQCAVVHSHADEARAREAVPRLGVEGGTAEGFVGPVGPAAAGADEVPQAPAHQEELVQVARQPLEAGGRLRALLLVELADQADHAHVVNLPDTHGKVLVLVRRAFGALCDEEAPLAAVDGHVGRIAEVRVLGVHRPVRRRPASEDIWHVLLEHAPARVVARARRDAHLARRSVDAPDPAVAAVHDEPERPGGGDAHRAGPREVAGAAGGAGEVELPGAEVHDQEGTGDLDGGLLVPAGAHLALKQLPP